jgi:hypothetical protein
MHTRRITNIYIPLIRERSLYLDPQDVGHYAPPLKWSISKSPEQAYDEIKSVYLTYPKRGLRWSSGWIDRGGWKPQLFGDSYFYANVHWH